VWIEEYEKKYELDEKEGFVEHFAKSFFMDNLFIVISIRNLTGQSASERERFINSLIRRFEGFYLSWAVVKDGPGGVGMRPSCPRSE
jgi:hypothetical protein